MLSILAIESDGEKEAVIKLALAVAKAGGRCKDSNQIKPSVFEGSRRVIAHEYWLHMKEWILDKNDFCINKIELCFNEEVC